MNDQPQPPSGQSSGGQPAGWYPDPEGSPRQRYWDGNAWTEHYNTPPVDTTPGAPAPAKKRSGCLTALAVVGGLVVVFVLIMIIALVASGGDDDDDDGGSVAGSGEDKTQEEEVTISSCGPPDAIGVVYAKGEADNTSSDRSDYIIDVVVNAPDGTQIGTGSTIAQNVESGQQALWTALTDVDAANWVEGSTCEVVDVERNASL